MLKRNNSHSIQIKKGEAINSLTKKAKPMNRIPAPQHQQIKREDASAKDPENFLKVNKF